MIAQSAAQQNQRREKEQIGIDDPLDLHAGHVEFRLKPGQDDIYDGRVDKHHARTENSSGQDSISFIHDVLQADRSKLTQENKAAAPKLGAFINRDVSKTVENEGRPLVPAAADGMKPLPVYFNY